MGRAVESFDSRETRGSPPREIVFRFSVLSCRDELEADGLVQQALAEVTPADFRDLEIDSESISLKKTGYDSFSWEGTWILPAVPEFPGGTSDPGQASGPITEFDTTGGTQHVTQCISQVDYGPEAAPAIRLARVVGLTRDGVDGVDVVIPKLELSITRTYPFATITSLYIKNLARMTGKVNIAPFQIDGNPFDAGELLFLGATGRQITKDNEIKWEIAFRFSASENRANIVVYEHEDEAKKITVGAKKGHDYLWVLYKKDEADNRFVEVPDVAFVSKLYEDANFASTLGFGSF